MEVRRPRWGPSETAPTSPIALSARSRCWIVVRRPRWGPSAWTPASPIQLRLRSSTWMDVRCDRWGPSDAAPTSPMHVRCSYWMQERLTSWDLRAIAALIDWFISSLIGTL